MLSEHKLSTFTIVIILCLYLFFPSGLSTTDAWYYAASIKYNGEIFHPHHLLYNALGLLFSWLPAKAGLETLASLKIMNALFAFLSLIVVQKILIAFKIAEKQIAIISCLAGLSFSILRFATENETYIVPLFFALLASLNYVKFISGRGDRFALYAGLMAAISVLFHQVYIFWWAGLMTGFLLEKRKRPAILYFLVSIIGPVVYLVIILVYEGTGRDVVNNFILGAFRGNASLGLTLKGLLLSFINLIRSFVQIHGYIYNMFKENPLLALPGLISLIMIFLAFLKIPGKIRINVSQRFCTVHIIIVILQFIFAVLSYGNAEFMVMIPVLIFMLVPLMASNYEKFIFRIMIAMTIWNISYGLIPLHLRTQAPEQFLCDAVLSKKNLIVIASDEQLLKSMLYYKSGDNNSKGILKSPAINMIKGEDQGILKEVIDNAIQNGTEIYTNCLDEEPVSRSSILEGNQNRDFFRNYQTTLIKSWKQNTGTKSIYKIEKKL
jgi:hypothetical protein